ncbi:hypothetical protein [Caulobacter rhizosphaerae]|uniref:hypothetical protein n=1 Tax=Caulobacter rhizosphaerae TaxID=2010972 RepID=UPI0013D4C5B6|nr:hypothetical protein [Caulobacter rhizosphaerae]
MSPATARKTRLRNGAVLGGSLALHAVILAVLGWPMAARFQDRSDDEDAIRVTLEREFTPRRPTPETVASADRAAAASPIQPRAPRRVAPSWIQPLGVAPVPGPPAPSNRATGVHPAPLPEGPRGDLRTALRGSSPGCANAQAVGLNRREQEHCDEAFGAKARNAPVYDAPMDAAKRRGFDAQALKQQADRAYRDAPMGVGVDHRNRDDPGKGKDIPWVLGAEQDGLGRSRSAEQQALKRLDDARKADERRKTAARQNEQR